MMSRFWNFVRKAECIEGRLPLVHSTDIFHFRSIAEEGKLTPATDGVYLNEKLLYFFYGRPSYRPNASLDTVNAKALLPICLIMARGLVVNPARIMPFDTGAFNQKMMHPPIHKKMDKEDFGLAISPDAPSKMISIFYGNDRNYFESRPKAALDISYDSYDDLEVDSYFRLLHHRANSRPDDRVTAIEYQVAEPIELQGKVEAAILPKRYLDRTPIQHLLETWSAIGIPYTVNEEFVPREAQGAIFQRLADYFEQHKLLSL